MKNIKSQVSMEFLILAGIAFLAVIVFVVASASELKEFRGQKEFFLIKDLALRLQKEVTISASVEDGYERSFSLPKKLDGVLDYYITTKNSTVTINSSKSVFTAAIPNVIGNFTKGSNKIEKINGEIYLNRE